MSYSSVYQGLQSCLEPRLIEIEPRVLKLKLAPPGSNSNLSPSSECLSSSNHSSSFLSLSESEAFEKPFTNTATQYVTESKSGWSFLQALSNVSHCNKTDGLEAENLYVHPSVKRSSSKFSAESLELCTESLGCESGSSNAGDSTDDMSLFSLESRSSESFNTTSVVARRKSKRWNRDSTSSFPPPLTSRTDLGGFQVRSHREDGRLILEAVTSSSPQPYFQAERANGRLRLRLFESVASCCGDDDDDDVGEDETLDNKEACDEEEARLVEVLEECVGCGEDETEMAKFARPSRCKESGNRDIFGDGYFELPSLSLCL